jgi:ABC-type cobalamin/Fe3+-siderophores transport system ATPase subunit
MPLQSLAQKTDIIFLDEPTTYLDISHQLEILELVQQLNKYVVGSSRKIMSVF